MLPSQYQKIHGTMEEVQASFAEHKGLNALEYVNMDGSKMEQFWGFGSIAGGHVTSAILYWRLQSSLLNCLLIWMKQAAFSANV